MTSELKCYCNSVVLQHAESLFDPREEIAAILVFDDKTVPFCIPSQDLDVCIGLY